jgi:hypothetical protein
MDLAKLAHEAFVRAAAGPAHLGIPFLVSSLAALFAG